MALLQACDLLRLVDELPDAIGEWWQRLVLSRRVLRPTRPSLPRGARAQWEQSGQLLRPGAVCTACVQLQCGFAAGSRSVFRSD